MKQYTIILLVVALFISSTGTMMATESMQSKKTTATTNKTTTQHPISCIGQISSAKPASTTALGIPYTTQVASSCAMLKPPAALIFFIPSNPSQPIPVIITATSFEPSDATESYITFTAGR